MKKILLNQLIILLSIIGFMSSACQKDPQNSAEIDGEWHLIEYTPLAEFPEEKQTFESGQIVWTFNSKENQIKVKINPGLEFNVIDEGSYNYKFGDNGCNYADNQFIIIGNNGLGTLIKTHIPEDRLEINDACVDGHILKFIR